MRDLGSDLRALVESAATPITVDEVMHTGAPSGSRHGVRRMRVLAAAAVLAVIAVVTALVVTRGSSPARVSTAPSSDDTGWEPALGPEPATPPIPDGWKVMDVGAVRFAVPSDWAVPYSADCASGSGPVSGMVLLPAARASGGCSPVQTAPPNLLRFSLDNAYATEKDPAAVPTRLGGVDVTYHPTLDLCMECSPLYELPDGMMLSATGPGIDEVLATFSDAGRLRALEDGPLADTSGWQPVSHQGVSFDVPPDWEIVDLPGSYTETTDTNGLVNGVSMQLAPGACSSPMFRPGLTPRASVGVSPGVPSCPGSLGFGVGVGDGAWIRADDPASVLPHSKSVARRSIGGLDVEAVRYLDEEGRPADPALELFVTGPGGKLHLSVGVGLDASIARTVVSTLRRTDAAPPFASTSSTAATSTTTAAGDTAPIQLDLVSIKPANPRPGEVVAITVRARTDGLVHAEHISLGDGRAVDHTAGSGCSIGDTADFGTPPSPPTGPSDIELSIQTTYFASGDYRLVWQVSAYDSCTAIDVPQGDESTELAVTVPVAPGETTGNGDLLPSAVINESIGWGGSDVQVEVSGEDQDGWVSELQIDWGDGSQPTTFTRTDPCTAGQGGWPSTARYATVAQHTYPAAGEYTAVLSVTSTDCTGADRQTATSSNRVVYPSR